MNKEQELQTAIADAITEYHAARESKTVTEVEALSRKVIELQKSLSTFLAAGANPCPDCETSAIGMIKTPAHINNDGVEVPNLYEVGCPAICPPVLVIRDSGVAYEHKGQKVFVKRWSHSARAWTPEQAVENWNSGKWVEDTKIDWAASPDVFEE